jgi:3-oxoacyl-[acyl-carrier protein] reductase
MQISEVRAVVTGAASGMGRVFVERLIAEGARVHACDVDAAGLADLAAATGASASTVDVSDEASVERLFDEAEAALGSVNVLLNNAGILRDGLLVKQDRETGAVSALSKEKWDRVLAVNLTGPFLCMRAFASRAVQRGIKPAVAVQMSSISRAGNMGQSNYSATKAALVADTVVWAKELGRYGVRVGAIAPGFIGTPMVRSMRPEVLEKVIKPVPLGRLGEPEEVWEAVRFIVSCEYFTGRVVEVDGGLRL